MPIYEYECGNCNAHHEAFQKITERPLRKCEKCGGKLHKLISQSSFHLKGSGWYVTDYGKKDKGKSESESESESKPAPKTESKKSESKPKSKNKDKS